MNWQTSHLNETLPGSLLLHSNQQQSLSEVNSSEWQRRIPAQQREEEEEEGVFGESYVGFPTAAGEIKVERDPQVLECLQVIAKAFAGKLPQGVLVPLGRFLHLSFLEDIGRAKHQMRDRAGNVEVRLGRVVFSLASPLPSPLPPPLDLSSLPLELNHPSRFPLFFFFFSCSCK